MSKKSLNKKIVKRISLVLIIGFSLAFTLTYASVNKMVSASAESQYTTATKLISSQIKPAVKWSNPHAINDIVKNFSDDKSFVGIFVYDESNKELYRTQGENIPDNLNKQALLLLDKLTASNGNTQVYNGTNNLIYIGLQIKDYTGIVGNVVVIWDKKDILSYFHNDMIFVIILFFVIFIIVVITLTGILRGLIINPIGNLTKSIGNYSKTGTEINFDKLLANCNSKELLMLLKSFRKMADDVKSSQKHMESALHEMEKAKRNAEKSDEMKTEFLGNMSHELRTPMHAILSFSDKGIKKIDNLDKARIVKYFTNINNSGVRLLELINNILDLTKFEAGKMLLNYADEDINQVIDQCLSEVSVLADDKKIKISVIRKEKYEKIKIDKNRIIQVMVNLLSNAIKFTPESGNILIKTEETFFADENAETGEVIMDMGFMLSVIDSGVGLPDDEVDRVFDKFIQSSRTNDKSGGTGLGLAICKQIIEAHKGHIYAQNNSLYDVDNFLDDNKEITPGARFVFVLPLTQ